MKHKQTQLALLADHDGAPLFSLSDEPLPPAWLTPRQLAGQRYEITTLTLNVTEHVGWAATLEQVDSVCRMDGQYDYRIYDDMGLAGIWTLAGGLSRYGQAPRPDAMFLRDTDHRDLRREADGDVIFA